MNNTWLFTWNPERWAWDDSVYGREEMSREISQIGQAFGKWTCGSTKSIQKGDRIFLIKLGKNPKGIVASGTALTDVFNGTHWDSERSEKGIFANRIYIQYDKIVSDDRLLSLDALKLISDKMLWTPQSSGIRIDSQTSELLEAEWAKY